MFAQVLSARLLICKPCTESPVASFPFSFNCLVLSYRAAEMVYG
jgi:hypothetical protein